jgi:hypothetical protein
MDNNRPSLDLKHFGAICPDNNGKSMSRCNSMDRNSPRDVDSQVPVIAVFTKYDQFKRDIKMKLQDEGCDRKMDLNTEVENFFNQHYLAKLNGPPPFIRLESEDHDVVN